MKRVLITGGRGYIGTNLKQFLIDKKIKVDIADRLDGNNVEYILDNRKFRRYSGIVHLAATSGIKNCMDDMKRAVINNVSASYRLFNMACKRKVPLVFSSSQAAKQPESNFYAMTKYLAEVEAIRLNKKMGANIKILRFCNVYGGLDYIETKGTVVAQFAKAVMNGDNMVINGPGTQVRDFIHVTDICNAIYKSLKHRDVVYRPIDIGSGVPVSVATLASFFEGGFTNNLESDKIGVSWNVADDSEAREILGFDSCIDIEDYAKEFKPTI